MAVQLSDIDWRLSGGEANSAPNAALGGAISFAEVVSGIIGGLFDDATAAEASAGDIEYRCVYLLNRNSSDSLTSVVVWVQSQTPSATTSIDIGLDPAGNGDGQSTGVAATIANEGTAPAGVTFSAPSSAGTGLSIGTLGPGQCRAIWLRRTINAGSAAASSDRCEIRVQATN